MKKFASLIALTGLAFSTYGQAPGDRIPDQYIVQLHPGANPADTVARHGVQAKFIYSAALNGFAGKIPPGLLGRLQADPQVASITPDRVVAIVGKPGGGGGGGGGGGTAQVTPLGVQRIKAPEAWATATGAGVGIAVVDTGIDLLNADLKVGTQGFSAFGGSRQDDHGHGTHVSGIAAANNNTLGVVGVAPNATLYAVKVLDAAGNGSEAGVIAGLNWIKDNADTVIPPIRVVNMSLGRTGTRDDDPAYEAAVNALTASGITVVVAAGNNASQEVANNVPATYPAVIAVASTTAVNGVASRRGSILADTASYFTTDGGFDAATGIGITISSPGEDAEDVNNGGLITSVGILSTGVGGGTLRMSGTSMAAPHVAGVVALLYQAHPGVTPEGARSSIIAGAERVGTAPLNSPTTSYSFDGDREGILSAPGALAH